MSSNSYNADGVNVEFGFGIQPQNKDGLIVRVNEIIQNQNTYIVDYRLKKVRFITPISAGDFINIFP